MIAIMQPVCSTFLLVGLFASSAYAVTIKDCTGGAESAAKLNSIEISDCPSTPGGVCHFVQGTNASIAIDFTTAKSFKTATVYIYGKIGVIKIPFPMSPSEACGVYGFDCPVLANERKDLKLSLPVLSYYPRIEVTIQLNLVDEDKKPVICIEFPAKIANA